MDPILLLRDRAQRLSPRARDLILRVVDALERPDHGGSDKPGPGVIVLDDALGDLDEAVWKGAP